MKWILSLNFVGLSTDSSYYGSVGFVSVLLCISLLYFMWVQLICLIFPLMLFFLGGESFVGEISDIDPLFQWSEQFAKMYLQFYINEKGEKVYTAKVWYTDWFHSSRFYNSSGCIIVGVFYEVLYIYTVIIHGPFKLIPCMWVCEHMCAIVDIPTSEQFNLCPERIYCISYYQYASWQYRMIFFFFYLSASLEHR